MPVYAISGVSKGTRYGFLKPLSREPKNVIIGIVRDKASTKQKIASELGDLPNIQIVQGDLTDYTSLQQAAAVTAKIVGGQGIDYLIANAGLRLSLTHTILGAGQWPDEVDKVSASLYQTNVTDNIPFINLFLSLVLKSQIKKLFAISSGHGDLDFINNASIETNVLYSASKVALNVIIAKFSVQYKKDGVLFCSVSPGAVDVGHYNKVPRENMAGMMEFMQRIQSYAPHFKGGTPVDDAIALLLSLLDRASMRSGYAGAFVSQHGNKQWL